MTNETELRNRIAKAIFNVRDDEFDLDEWDDLDATDRERYTCDAQAIIDDLGLHYVDSEEYAKVGLDWLEVEKGRHVVGRWEKQ